MRMNRVAALNATLFVLGALVFGSLWQIEISILNDFHGWTFGYLFTWIQGVSNWAARDFFFAVIGASFLFTVYVAFLLGKAYANIEKQLIEHNGGEKE
jgi:hypothetical protein